MKRILFTITILMMSYSAMAEDYWHRISTEVFTRVEVKQDGRIILQKAWEEPEGVSITSINHTTDTWTDCNSIIIEPPAGIEKQYLSVVLTAISTGKDIYVMTTSTTKQFDIFSSRIQMD